MALNNLRALKQRRIELRKRLTPAEAALWNQLKQSKLAGYKFRRQHSIGPYIVDFYCPAAKLAVEIDGEIHKAPEAQEYDRVRDAYLLGLGVRILRFENQLVFDGMAGVLREIQTRLTE
jgi:very-short-patch-repair endonuclease